VRALVGLFVVRVTLLGDGRVGRRSPRCAYAALSYVDRYLPRVYRETLSRAAQAAAIARQHGARHKRSRRRRNRRRSHCALAGAPQPGDTDLGEAALVTTEQPEKRGCCVT